MQGLRLSLPEALYRNIFGNSTNLGIICVTAGDLERETLAKAIEADPQLQVTIDIDAGEIRYGKHRLEALLKQMPAKVS